MFVEMVSFLAASEHACRSPIRIGSVKKETFMEEQHVLSGYQPDGLYRTTLIERQSREGRLNDKLLYIRPDQRPPGGSR